MGNKFSTPIDTFHANFNAWQSEDWEKFSSATSESSVLETLFVKQVIFFIVLKSDGCNFCSPRMKIFSKYKCLTSRLSVKF